MVLAHGETILTGVSGTRILFVEQLREGRRHSMDRHPEFPGADQPARSKQVVSFTFYRSLSCKQMVVEASASRQWGGGFSRPMRGEVTAEGTGVE